MAVGWLVFIDGTDFLDNLGIDSVKHNSMPCAPCSEQGTEQPNTMINTILCDELGKGQVY